jgi:hypothetical protein
MLIVGVGLTPWPVAVAITMVQEGKVLRTVGVAGDTTDDRLAWAATSVPLLLPCSVARRLRYVSVRMARSGGLVEDE